MPVEIDRAKGKELKALLGSRLVTNDIFLSRTIGLSSTIFYGTPKSLIEYHVVEILGVWGDRRRRLLHLVYLHPLGFQTYAKIIRLNLDRKMRTL